MTENRFARGGDFEMDELLTLHTVAETTGAHVGVVMRLVRLGLLEAADSQTGEPMVACRAVVRLRYMQRLRRDLEVNFAGAAVILDLMERMDEMNREIMEMRQRTSSR